MKWDTETITETQTFDNETPEPLKFERRLSDRWPTDVMGTAFELGGQSFGHMHQIRVLDYSEHGLGAISSTALNPGTVISVGFSAPGMVAKRGTVLQCTPCGGGYRIGVQFEARIAA